MTFSTIVKKRRLTLGRSLTEVADGLGWHYSYLSMVENGARVPGVVNALKLMRALRMDLGALKGIKT